VVVVLVLVKLTDCVCAFAWATPALSVMVVDHQLFCLVLCNYEVMCYVSVLAACKAGHCF